MQNSDFFSLTIIWEVNFKTNNNHKVTHRLYFLKYLEKKKTQKKKENTKNYKFLKYNLKINIFWWDKGKTCFKDLNLKFNGNHA